MHDWPAWLKPATAIFWRRGLAVGVGLDDHRRVVAELEADLLLAARAPDAPADVGRAGEGDHGDVGVVDERVADRAAAAGDDVELLRRAARTRRAAARASAIAESGVWRAGLSTTGQPAAIAGATLWATRLSGKLNGLIAADHADRHPQRERELALAGVAASIGTISPASVRAATAANVKVDTARWASTRAVFIGLAASRGDGAGEVLGALVEEPGGAVEDLGPSPRRQRTLAEGVAGPTA